MQKKTQNTLIISLIIVITLTAIIYCCYVKRSNKYTFKYFQTAIIISLGEREDRLSVKVVDEIDTLLKTQEIKWFNKPDSSIIELNTQLAKSEYFTVDDETLKIIKLIQEFHKKSDSYFNPTMGMLFHYWENTAEIKQPNDKLNLRDYLSKLPVPEDVKIKFDAATKTYSIKNTNPYLQLDIDVMLSAHVLSKIKQILLANGVKDAELVMDNDLYLIKKGDEQTYKIIETHTNSSKMPTLNITTYDEEFVAISGTLVRHKAHQSANAPNNIINPKTGKPSDGFYGATVIDKDPYKASVASMTLILAGEHEYRAIAKSLGVTDYILYTYNNKIILSDGMRKRLTPPGSSE